VLTARYWRVGSGTTHWILAPGAFGDNAKGIMMVLSLLLWSGLYRVILRVQAEYLADIIYLLDPGVGKIHPHARTVHLYCIKCPTAAAICDVAARYGLIVSWRRRTSTWCSMGKRAGDGHAAAFSFLSNCAISALRRWGARQTIWSQSNDKVPGQGEFFPNKSLDTITIDRSAGGVWSPVILKRSGK